MNPNRNKNIGLLATKLMLAGGAQGHDEVPWDVWWELAEVVFEELEG